MKVSIKNFQSIEDATLDIPEKAFTCIVGPSNIGKSAIRRALECLIYNKSEVSYIRNGTKSCSVEVVFDDGTCVVWYRDKKTAGYKINGEDFTKLAGSVPEVLIDKGFKELVVNKDKYQVQIASQFNNLFLLNETGGKVTEMLSNLGNLNRIINANKSCLSDLKSNKSRLTIRREDLVSSKEKIKSYKGLDEQRHLLDSFKDSLKQIKEIKEKSTLLKKIEVSLSKSVSLVKILRPSKDISVSDFDLDINKLNNLKKLLSKHNKLEKTVLDYSNLKNVKDILFDISSEKLFLLKKLFNKFSNSEVLIKSYSKIKEIPEIDFTIEEDYKKYSSLKVFLSKLEKATNKVFIYNNLPKEIPEIDNLNLSRVMEVKKLYKALVETKESVISLREKIINVSKNLTNLEEERDNIHRTLKICPLCDKEF